MQSPLIDSEHSPHRTTPGLHARSHQEISREGVRGMFDRIAHRYDFLNHFLSLGLDFYWRQRLRVSLDLRGGHRVVDLACGTGDVAFCMSAVPGLSIAGIDFAGNMLKGARRKQTRRARYRPLRFLQADGMRLPLGDSSCDRIAMAFGIRNVVDPAGCLGEIFRVLKPGGRACILEFSRPRHPLIQRLYGPYLRWFVPNAGGLVSGDVTAYTYLDRTIQSFPEGDLFLKLMHEAGFTGCRQERLSLGIVTIYTGERQE